MKNTTFLLVLAFLSLLWNMRCPAQTGLLHPDSILQNNYKPVPVMLLGTFHFAYYNLDAHKVKEENQVDVFSEKVQKELDEIRSWLMEFRPTKVVIESGANTGYLMNHYRDWIKGKSELKKDEIHQLAFPVLKQLNLDTLYGVDAGTLVWSLYDSKDSLCMREPIDSIFKDWDFENDDDFSMRYKQYYNYKDSMSTLVDLTELIRYMNTQKYRERTYGSYLCGDFRNGDNTEGADALAMHWYSRNLRIFRNIQKIINSENDRILVIYGAGHMGILDHLFRASPEFELVDWSY